MVGCGPARNRKKNVRAVTTTGSARRARATGGADCIDLQLECLSEGRIAIVVSVLTVRVVVLYCCVVSTDVVI
jgi:hypothetical protein